MAGVLRDDGTNGYKADALTTEQYVNTGRDPNGLAENPTGAKQMYVNIGHPSFGDSSRLAWAVGHESGHSAGLEHPRNANGIVPYLMGATKAQRKAYADLTPEEALKNPDKYVQYGYRRRAPQ
ncbi:MAG: hypothetical protein H6923_09520 [Alphaproteobacteria bacterium]|nr:hypothetical protein [Alphaproteobacteria bacterium]